VKLAVTGFADFVLVFSSLLKPKMIDPILEQRKADYMEYLYEWSGRTNGLYTGLLQERKRFLVDRDMLETVGPKLWK